MSKEGLFLPILLFVQYGLAMSMAKRLNYLAIDTKKEQEIHRKIIALATV